MSEPPAFPIERVLQGYGFFRGLLLVVYGGFLALGFWTQTNPELPAQAGPMGLVIAGMGALFGAGVVASFFAPRAPWAWSVHGAVIALGIPLCVTTPFALAMGWVWLHPAVKLHFGVQTNEAMAQQEGDA